MSGIDDKKTSNENAGVPTQIANPAMLIISSKLPTTVKFPQDGLQKEYHNDNE